LRNTIQSFWRKWIQTTDDGVNPPFDQFVYEVGASLEELANRIAIQEQLIRDSLPPGWTATFSYPLDPITTYLCLDKNTVMAMFKALPTYYYANGVEYDPTIPISQQAIRFVYESPRKTGWTDTAGVKRDPAPTDKGEKSDFSGAQTLVDAFLALSALEASLREIGRLRDAGIVQFAIDQVNANVWSITEAFAYLIKNRIIATNG